MSDQAHAQEKNEVTESESEAEVSKDERKWETVCNCCWASRGLEAEKIEAVYWLLVYWLLAIGLLFIGCLLADKRRIPLLLPRQVERKRG